MQIKINNNTVELSQYAVSSLADLFSHQKTMKYLRI